MTRIRREPPVFRRARVAAVEPRSPWMVQVTIEGPALEGLAVDEPAASGRLLLPSPGTEDLVIPDWNGNEFLLPDGSRPAIRTLTPSRTRADARVLVLSIVLHDGGIGAVCMWELDGLEIFSALREVRRRFDPNAPDRKVNYRSVESLQELFETAGFRDVETKVLESAVEYSSVDEIWDAAIHVGDPGGPIANAFSPERLAEGRGMLDELLGSPTGSFTLRGRAAAVRGVR